ncbi:hypothetical protein LCGC14_0546060 [marine sediment metagenome]|uniref:Uncharacterized protein n=1 Tax=marine sediment metagenome TaxID=412755 RepID=A0A0F9UCS5_9ZZZZ
MEISRGLRNKLTAKKNILNLKKLEFVIQRMYNLISKHKMWDEIKEAQKK